MRTTIDLPEDLHRIATSLARHTGRSLGQTVAELMRRGLATPEQPDRIGEAAVVYRLHPLTGLPVVASRQPVTGDDVEALDDEP
ncbi:MAG: antitoxin [Lysobacter sp.]|nr:antitoxin [Lysobacter sp.]